MSDPSLLRRKGKERHIFLFEQALLFCKVVKEADGKVKYLFKHKLKVRHENLEILSRPVCKPPRCQLQTAPASGSVAKT